MKWLDERRAKKQSQAEELSAKAREIMETIDSPYTEAKLELAEYEKDVKFDASSAYKHAKKAYESAVAESEAARIHSDAIEVLEDQKRVSEKKVASYEADYRLAAAKGDSKGAMAAAKKLYIESAKYPDPGMLKITLDRSMTEEGTARVVVTNKGDAPMVINSIRCTCGNKDILAEGGMSEALQPGAQTSRAVSFEAGDSVGIAVYVEYESGLETRQVRRNLALIDQV